MTHEFDGRQYAKVSAHQREWGAKLIAELSLRGDEYVLDLGCGDDANTAKLAELVPDGQVVGIDASQGMIASARPKEKKNLRFMILDIDAMNFTDKFDVIYSNATLHWAKDHQRLLHNVHKALKTGGRARFNFAGDDNCAHFFKVVRLAMARDEFFPYFKGFPWPWYMPVIDEYTQLATTSQFIRVKVWGENADRFFPDSEALSGWLDQPSLVPFLSHVPEPHKAAFRNYVVDQMIQETQQADGRYFETFRRINLFAAK